MRLQEAYQVLGIPKTATPEEAKQAYKLAAKKYHPDINPAPEASQKMQQINEAYEKIQKGEEAPSGFPTSWNGHFQRQQIIQPQNIEINLTIDFKESVLGCKKDIKYTRSSKCQACDGAGEVKLDNGCKECGGKGQVVNQSKGMIMVSTCTKCYGKTNIADCSTCYGEGALSSEVSVNISVPAGILNNNTLRLQGMGNYAGTMMGIMDQHSDVYAHISVIPDEGLSIDGKSVITTLNLPLLEALKGCQKSVKTIFGEKQITIPPASRHKEEIIIPKCGVSGVGDQRVILDISYPVNTNQLIALLEGQYLIPLITESK